MFAHLFSFRSVAISQTTKAYPSNTQMYSEEWADVLMAKPEIIKIKLNVNL